MSAEYIIDADKKSIGRVASVAASFLNGKNEVDFTPNKVADVKVRVINISRLKINPRKAIQKKYYTHSGYMGSLKSKTLKEMVSDDVIKLFRNIVKNMLPANRLMKIKMKKLKVEL